MAKRTTLKDVTFLVFIRSKTIDFEVYSLCINCIQKSFNTTIIVIDQDLFRFPLISENIQPNNMHLNDTVSDFCFFITPEIYSKLNTPIVVFYSGECIVSLETMIMSIDILRNHLAECVVVDHKAMKIDLIFKKFLEKTGDIRLMSQNLNKLFYSSPEKFMGLFSILKDTLLRFNPSSNGYVDSRNKKVVLGKFIRNGYVVRILRGNVFEI